VRPTWELAPATQSEWQPSPHEREIPPAPQRSGAPTMMIAIIAVVVVLVGAGGWYLFGGSSGTGFDVNVTKCGASGSVATIGLEVHNRGSSTGTATVRIEYRDKSGKVINTDTALVRDIGGGDTERVDQSTILDADPDPTMTCHVTAVA
jgi:hypothetical protein